MKGVFMPFGKALLRGFFLEKGVITPFHLALLCLSKMHYYAFLKGIITPFLKVLLRLSKSRYYAFFMHRRRNNAIPRRVITPISCIYAF